jgi:hypothetical protein
MYREYTYSNDGNVISLAGVTPLLPERLQKYLA